MADIKNKHKFCPKTIVIFLSPFGVISFYLNCSFCLLDKCHAKFFILLKIIYLKILVNSQLQPNIKYLHLFCQKFTSNIYQCCFESFYNKFDCILFSSVQFSRSVMSDSATPWIAACQASLSITNYQSPPKPMSIVLVMPSNHLILCRPLLLLPSIFPSIRVFSNESTLCIRWPK